MQSPGAVAGYGAEQESAAIAGGRFKVGPSGRAGVRLQGPVLIWWTQTAGGAMMRQSSEPYTGFWWLPHLFPDVLDYLPACPMRPVASFGATRNWVRQDHQFLGLGRGLHPYGGPLETRLSTWEHGITPDWEYGVTRSPERKQPRSQCRRGCRARIPRPGRGRRRASSRRGSRCRRRC